MGWVLLIGAAISLCGHGFTGWGWLLVLAVALVVLEQLRSSMAGEWERIQARMDAILGRVSADDVSSINSG